MVSAPSLFSRRYLWYQMPQLINNSDCVIYKNADIQYVTTNISRKLKKQEFFCCVLGFARMERIVGKRGALLFLLAAASS